MQQQRHSFFDKMQVIINLDFAYCTDPALHEVNLLKNVVGTIMENIGGFK